jgi:putative phage-type endonuclease
MINYELEQGTAEWKQQRAGWVTGSRMCDVMATLKSGGEAASRRNYRAEIVAEILTGVPTDQYVSKEMQWGTDNEPFARASYEIQREVEVVQVGFAMHDVIERLGASPDGLVGEDGLVEFKCPNTSQHIAYRLSGSIPGEYQLQMLTEMACTGRQWCDFVSFDPRLPERMQLSVKRFLRDDARIAIIEAQVQKFLDEVDQEIAALDQTCGATLQVQLEGSLAAVKA